MFSTRWAPLGVLGLFLAAAPALAQDATSPSSELMPLTASQGLILDMTETDSRAIAVGARGAILVSESRTDWRQIENVPTRATLTAVSGVGNAVWAVGHDGTIVASNDGGLTWTLQREDVLRPQDDPSADFDPRQGVPLLDVLMITPEHGFAVGAYSQLLRTDDGGATWNFVPTAAETSSDEAEPQPADDEDSYDDSMAFSDEDLALDDEAEPHFNAIARTGSGALFIVGERGAAFRSRDDGQTWERLQLPYAGSMFGVLSYAGNHVIAFGMRGNVFESRDLGDTWTQIDTDTELSLMGGTAVGAGGFALVGANGVVLTRANAGAQVANRIYANRDQETPVLAGVLARPDGSLLLAGEKGVDRFAAGEK